MASEEKDEVDNSSDSAPPSKISRRSTTLSTNSANTSTTNATVEPSGDDELDLLSVNSTNLSLDSSRSATPTFGRRGKRGKRGPKPAAQFRYKSHLKEDHGLPLFGIQINHNTKDKDPLLFATVGSNRATIYECHPSGDMKLVQAYCDPDPSEGYYTCVWTSDDRTRQALLVVAGAKGLVRVICPATKLCIKHFIGHGNAINELRVHPSDPNLILSVSKDHNIRLWNLRTDVCVVIFGGVEGHRAEVLSADFNLDGTRIVSCGMDHSLKIWHLDKPLISEAIENSYKYEAKDPKSFSTACAHFPDLSTRDVHHNYVDCVRYFGNLLLSKSCENRIACWKAGKLTCDEKKTEKDTSVLHQFQYKDCDIWFMRFCLDYSRKAMALGNQVGKVFIWDLDVDDPQNARCSTLANHKCTAAIRQCDFSKDGNVLLAVADDATIWRWEKMSK